MAHFKNFLLTLFFITLIISFLPNNAYAGGFAAGPGKIYFNDVLRGGYSEVEVYLYNPEDLISDIELSVAGPFADWLYFDSGKKFSIPAKSSRYIKAHVEPPADVANGVYNGSVHILSKPRRIAAIEDQYGMAIETAISLKVFAEITGKQIVKYEVKNIAVGCVEEGYLIPFSFVGVNRGNVRISPGAQIDIYKGDKSALIKSENFTGEETLPTTEQTYLFNMSSENLAEGQYWANISVFAGGALVGSKFITFDIMKKGSLTKKGELINVRASEPWSSVGDVVRIDAVFKNTGQLTTDAKFKGEVYAEGILIKTLESDELEVPVGSTANLTVYYTPERTGRYEVKGVVHYSGKVTYEKGTIINVLPKGAYQESAPLKREYFLFGGVVFVILILWVWVLKRNREDKEHTLKTVSRDFKSVESTLEKIIRNTKRMNKKVQRLKTRHSQ